MDFLGSNSGQHSQHHNYIPADEPCSSKSLFQQPQPVPQQLQDPYKLSAGDFPGRERSLSEQLADTLLLASPKSPGEPIQSPHDIYKEIVCECAHFEQQPGASVFFELLIMIDELLDANAGATANNATLISPGNPGPSNVLWTIWLP